MKRKRGRKHKSGKAPKVAVVGVSDADGDVGNLSEQDMSGGDSGPTTVDDIKDETNVRTKVEVPVLTVTDLPVIVPSVGLSEVSDKPSDKPVAKLVYNRVKVRIKTPKALEPQLTTSEVAHTQGDVDKSSQRIGVEKQAVVSVSEKVEDSATANSTPETNAVGATTQPKIKIKTSLKGFSSTMSPCNNTVVPPVERVPSVERVLPVERVQPVERTHQKEPEIVARESVYNKQELNASLEVIKKIMKMDAAEPFKAPVNPVALGIPDYFDVIKTPMDFGTICKNLESGIKYMNSEDVHKDVQFIWENCYKYNNKGDYVLELMKRVKKNFSKYWSAAGLYSEQQGDVKDGNTSSHGKSSNKGGNLKNKSKKSRGAKRHKDDCLCAICIMVRRRQERERLMNPADDQTETSDGGVKEVKHQQEGTSIGDDTSSSTDNSQNQDDVVMEDAEEKSKPEKEIHSTLESKQQEEKETASEGYTEIAIVERSQQDISMPEVNEDIQLVEAGNANKDHSNSAEQTKQHEDEPTAVEPQKHKEVLDAGEKAKLYEKLHKRYNNPLVLELYSSLYRGNDKSVLSRPISLGQRRRGSSRSSAISAAITTFMKK